ncbi:hypothetical protein HK102_011943, partial [Quaeritorhiza haematococci]
GGGGPPRTTSTTYRHEQLRLLWRCLIDNREAIEDALCKDGATLLEARREIARAARFVAEVANGFEEALEPMRRGYWAMTLLSQFVQQLKSRRDPLGVVLIIGARVWPLATAVEPFAAAMAAGNAVALVPSVDCPNTTRTLSILLSATLDPDSYAIFPGGLASVSSTGITTTGTGANSGSETSSPGIGGSYGMLGASGLGSSGLKTVVAAEATSVAAIGTGEMLDAVLDERFNYVYCGEADSRIKQLVIDKAAQRSTPVDAPPSGC